MTDILVASMWKPFYQRRATAFARRLSGRFTVTHVSAELTDRSELISALSSGPPLAVYFGHGHSAGWTGFRGVRARDIPFIPSTTILSFSCSALDEAWHSTPFGRCLVHDRRVKAFIGTNDAMNVAGLAQLAVVFSETLKPGAGQSIDTLMTAVGSKVAGKNNRGLSTAWGGMGAIGDTTSDLFPSLQDQQGRALADVENLKLQDRKFGECVG